MIENAARWPACRSSDAVAQRRGGDRPQPEDPEGGRRRSRREGRRSQTHGADRTQDGGRARPGAAGKNGKGFYEYPGKAGQEISLAGSEGALPQKDAGEIEVGVLKQRLLVTIALEAARTIEEGIVTDPPRKPMSARSSASALHPTPAARSPTSTAWARKPSVELCEKARRRPWDPLPADAASEGDGRKGRDLLRALDPYGAAKRRHKPPGQPHAQILSLRSFSGNRE